MCDKDQRGRSTRRWKPVTLYTLRSQPLADPTHHINSRSLDNDITSRKPLELAADRTLINYPQDAYPRAQYEHLAVCLAAPSACHIERRTQHCSWNMSRGVRRERE